MEEEVEDGTKKACAPRREGELARVRGRASDRDREGASGSGTTVSIIDSSAHAPLTLVRAPGFQCARHREPGWMVFRELPRACSLPC